jgi:hypothetical protein
MIDLSKCYCPGDIVDIYYLGRTSGELNKLLQPYIIEAVSYEVIQGEVYLKEIKLYNSGGRIYADPEKNSRFLYLDNASPIKIDSTEWRNHSVSFTIKKLYSPYLDYVLKYCDTCTPGVQKCFECTYYKDHCSPRKAYRHVPIPKKTIPFEGTLDIRLNIDSGDYSGMYDLLEEAARRPDSSLRTRGALSDIVKQVDFDAFRHKTENGVATSVPLGGIRRYLYTVEDLKNGMNGNNI